ncbi:zinc-finger homeodomain protein 6-like [Canna indica]|uniref:Zinc-finger homeodomain protein 6-like n=1 Tax=Canna indica TaxID=4628 RepID=A0AAQ3KWU2_9LILI|nr:zinc-finger homeodomain protein 6-like [Canna indica]
MEYKRQVHDDEEEEDEDDDEEEDDDIDQLPSSSTALGFNPLSSPLSLRGSAFSKPILSPSSSLISPRGAAGASSSAASIAKNVSLLGSSTDPAPLVAGASTGPTHPKPSAAKNAPPATAANASIRYRECLRNHAAAAGGHVLDGCGEFMPEGGAAALNCAACGCHRSFHRKETDGEADAFGRGGSAARLPFLLPPPLPHLHQRQVQSGAMALGGNGASGSAGTTTESSSEERINAGPPGVGAQRKRFRTKFTVEQKEKMLALAERIGWRILKQDEALVEQSCADAGVRRHVFKVWMHNNKHLIKKPQQPRQADEPLKQRSP